MGICKLRKGVAVLAALMAWPAASYAQGATQAFTFGVGPQQSTGELARRWVPIFDYLNKKTGYTIHFATAKDIPTFQRETHAGKFDFVYINPYHYALFHRSAGYDAFAREKDATLTGVLVVAKNGGIDDVAALNGKEVAFPAPSAVAATVLPMMYFKEKHISVVPRYVVSHDSVYRAVAKGLYPAGGGEMRTFDTSDPAIRARLRVLWSAQPLPPFAFAAHPRVPKDAVKRIQAAMLAMDADEQGRALLKGIDFKGIVAATDKDYDGMRKLNIEVPK